MFASERVSQRTLAARPAVSSLNRLVGRAGALYFMRGSAGARSNRLLRARLPRALSRGLLSTPTPREKIEKVMQYDAFDAFAIHEGKSYTRQSSRRTLIMMDKRFGKLAAQLHAAEAEHGDVVVEIKPRGILARVSHAGLALE